MRLGLPRGAIRSLLGVGLLSAELLLGFAPPVGAQGIGLEQLRDELAWGKGSLVLFDALEYAPAASGRPLRLDAVAWYGGAYNRLWLRADGDQSTRERGGEIEAELFFGRLITPYWDALVGARVDRRWGEAGAGRAHLAVGVTGLAPLRFEFSPTLYVSQDGDFSAQLKADYLLLVTQRLAAAPGIELRGALQEVPEWGIGSGLNSIETSLRFHYHVRQEFAPYVGFFWIRRLGGSADFARAAGEAAGDGSFVAGLRVWR